MKTSPDRTDDPGVAPVTAREGEPDPAGDLTYSATGLPPGVRIGPDGALSGAVSVRALGTHTVTLTTAGPTRVLRQVTFDWIVL